MRCWCRRRRARFSRTIPTCPTGWRRWPPCVPPDRLLRCIEAVLECREALAVNVKPKFAVDAMVATVGQALRN